MRIAVKLLAVGLAFGTVAGIASIAGAQPQVRDHRKEPEVRDHRTEHHDDKDKDKDRDHRPHVAPPAPQAEKVETKPGFVWAKGRWDWKMDKWEWVAGHWERERAGKQWRDAHWEAQGDTWVFVDGVWVDAGAAGSPTPPPGNAPPPPVGAGNPPTTAPNGNPGIVPPGVVRDHRRDWKLERPIVSSYWPTKGKTGQKIVIRGKNFPAGTEVHWEGQLFPGAKIEGDKIVIAAGGTTGMISLHFGHGPDVLVGKFEVADDAAAAAAAAAQKQAEEAARKKAEQDWAAMQKAQAADKAAREAAAKKRWEDAQASREDRRQKRADELRAKWDAAFLADVATQDELTLHGQRLAQLERAKDIAGIKADGKLVVRIGVALDTENARHDQRMADLKAAFKGGAQ